MTASDDRPPRRTLVDQDRLLAVLAEEAGELAEAAETTRLDGVVPGCPGLTLGETARHVGSLYRMVFGWLREGTRPATWQREPKPGQGLPDYVRSGVAPLLGELAAHDPAEPCPTWWPEESNYGFWRRRMAHETLVHRCDVQGAAGGPVGPIADAVALDGIDEILTLWFVHRMRVLGVAATRDYVVSIRAGGLEWLARATTTGNVTRRPVDPETAADDVVADAIVSGTPTGVYLWLWGRKPDQAVTREGNLDAIAQLWALLRLGTR